MAAKLYRLRTEPVVAWEYTGQPKSMWPRWLKAHYSGPLADGASFRIGRYAIATREGGRLTFWRWMDAGPFLNSYELVEDSAHE